MATPNWIRTTLDQRGVRYEERNHPEAYTASAVAHQEHVSGHRVAKVVVALADGRPLALVLPASRRVLLERVREILDCRILRLATEEEIITLFPSCEPGAIPPLASWPGVPVLMDDSLRVDGRILFRAGTHRDAISVRFADWFRIVQPAVSRFSTI